MNYNLRELERIYGELEYNAYDMYRYVCEEVFESGSSGVPMVQELVERMTEEILSSVADKSDYVSLDDSVVEKAVIDYDWSDVTIEDGLTVPITTKTASDLEVTNTPDTSINWDYISEKIKVGFKSGEYKLSTSPEISAILSSPLSSDYKYKFLSNGVYPHYIISDSVFDGGKSK